MGFWNWLRGGPGAPPVEAPPVQQAASAAAARPATEGERWYVTTDDPDRFQLDADGLPPFRLIAYQDGLRLCEDATGLLIGPTDRRLFGLGVYSYNAVGEFAYPSVCKAGDFSPGAPVRLVREPDNPHDPNAVAIKAEGSDAVAAYVSRGHAKRLAKLLDAGLQVEGIATRGTRPGVDCEAIAVVAAEPRIMARLRSPRPAHLPAPVFTKG